MNKTNTKICAVIIARNGSSRLPNKALANICGKTILELISERISHSNQIQKTIIATSTNFTLSICLLLSPTNVFRCQL